MEGWQLPRGHESEAKRVANFSRRTNLMLRDAVKYHESGEELGIAEDGIRCEGYRGGRRVPGSG